jgi:hypothetical protein
MAVIDGRFVPLFLCQHSGMFHLKETKNTKIQFKNLEDELSCE